MPAFTDSQLRAVWAAAVFVERVVARLRLHRGFTDADSPKKAVAKSFPRLRANK